MNKNLISFLASLSLAITLSGCSASTEKQISEDKYNVKIESIEKIDTYIDLNDGINIKGEGVKVDKNTITIKEAGNYSISGKLDDGKLVVDASDSDDVYILLDNADISCSNNSAINIINADKVVIGTKGDTVNKLSDGSSYDLATGEDEPNATIFSKADLVIIGDGSLEISGNYNNGITSKDDLRIQGGDISINAQNHGMKGKDCVHILDGNIDITSGGDGIKSTNVDDEDRGYIYIEGGNINIDATEDGIQAETNLIVNGGNIDIKSGGGSQNSSTKSGWGEWKRDFNTPGADPKMQAISNSSDVDTQQSAKAIKSTKSIEINGGKINIDSSDDAIHSNDTLKITEGNINIASGDDGIHADTSISINGGNINISKSYEGIESAQIDIDGGDINISASDDGINISGGNDSSSIGRVGENNFKESKNSGLNINGGKVIVDASGDGLDSNGYMEINDGIVIVNGPTNGGNSSLDFDSRFDINGGTLIAVGSSEMLQNPSDTSKQNIISVLTDTQNASTLVHIEDTDGNEIITFEPTKNYSSFIISTSNIKKDTEYKVYIGGSYSGKEDSGIYSQGKYTKGNEIGSIEISNVVNTIGSVNRGMNPNNPMPQNGMGNMPGKPQNR